MKRKNIFLIAFVSMISFIAGWWLWRYIHDAKKGKAAHVVLVGEKVARIAYGNRMLSFLENNPKYCVWYVLPEKAAGSSNKQAIAVDDIMDKEKVIRGIKALAKKGLALDNIQYMLVLPNTKESFALQKDLHKKFNVKAGCTAGTMEDILAQYQKKDIDGQHEVHLVLKDGEKLVANAMKYTTSLDKQAKTFYESYIVLRNKDKADLLIKAAMKFAKAKAYANGGLTVYFDAKDKIKGIKPFSRLFLKLSYRTIFESYRPSSKQKAYQGRVYCSIQSGGDAEQEGTWQWSPPNINIKDKWPTSLKSISRLEENGIKMVDNISLKRECAVPVGGQVVIHLENDTRKILARDINALTNNASYISFWSAR